jgi:molecular chaperone HtpG
MEKKEFKTESRRILDLMVNSVYTHKEIFLREIISNASDALDKLAYRALTDDKVGLSGDDFYIKITADKDSRILTVSDNGIGMTKEELESNLGVIAQSGSLSFKKELLEKGNAADIDIIGQFGVGFYSAFMVSKKVTVVSRAYGSDKAFKWESEGVDGYTISEAERDNFGTDVIMALKDDTNDEKYSDFLDFYNIKRIVKKYSDYIRFAIKMDVPKTREVELDELDEKGNKKTKYETYYVLETINSRVPIWKRSKEEAPDEECFKFYKEKYFEAEDPLACIRINAEGTTAYRAMLFVPASAPLGYYSKDYEKGLELYSNGVMIINKCPELLPEHFRFVRGVVDSDDLPLNISREMLQHSRQLNIIASNIEKRIKRELKKMLEDEREKYEKFFKAFGLQLKYGIVNEYGAHKELLSDLLLFYSSKKGAMLTLSEYVKNMPPEQKYIYYACGASVKLVESLPQTELIREKDYDILCMTDEIDEFVVGMLGKYEDKEFRSASSDDLGIISEEQKKETTKKAEENKELLDFVKESLNGAVSSVKISEKLKTRPCFLSTEGGVTIEMEKYFAALPGENKLKAQKVLELNATHKVFAALKNAYETDKDKAAKLSKILYNQALLIAGLPLEDPSGYSEIVCDLIS